MRRPSSTARTVLQGVWLTACDPATRHLVSPDLAAVTRVAMERTFGPRRTRLFESAAVRRALRLTERVALPGVCSHYVSRKNVLHAEALAASVERLVVLGGGLDALAWRTAGERPAVRCVEIDHPATQADKRHVMAGLPDRGVGLVPCDLGDPVAAERAIVSLPNLPTLFVAEGLLMYLPTDAVRRLLAAVARRGDRAILSFMTPDARGRPAFQKRQWLVRQYLTFAQEPFTWALRPEAAAAWMANVGLHVQWTAGAPWQGADVRLVPGMITGELLCGVEPCAVP